MTPNVGEQRQGAAMGNGRRVAIVTGGARGIGSAIATALAANGIHLVIADNDIDMAEMTADEIRALGVKAIAINSDVSKNQDVVRLVDETVATFGRLDILVNNAGILSNTPFDEVSEAEWDRVLDTNLKGAMFATREALRPMQAQGWGRVISISSLAGRSGGVSVGPAYVASKAGLIGLTRHLAKVVAKCGVTVNAVAPGTTETDLVKGFTEEQTIAINAAIPIGRLGKPEEIAAMVAFLASDAAAFITGAVIDVNGGMYMG
jgi:NAD(P)-dependent dehydrogenase (short-subunit alcohol dehydrogenase family)